MKGAYWFKQFDNSSLLQYLYFKQQKEEPHQVSQLYSLGAIQESLEILISNENS